MHHKFIIGLLWMLSAAAFSQPAYRWENLSTEALNRGLIAIRQSEDSLTVCWRLLREDPESITFDLYLADSLLVKNTSLTYLNLPTRNIDFSHPNKFKLVANDSHGKVMEHLKVAEYILPCNPTLGCLDIQLNRPVDQRKDRTTPCEYFAGDCAAADVDGDGQLEIIVKWDPSNAHDNAHDGYTGNVFIDCYSLTPINATSTEGSSQNFRWRIDLGPNIRAGAHYTQVMAYDLDGDQKAEIVLKTADGTIDGKGNVIGNPNAYFVNDRGRILEGPEYLSVFSGETGEALYTTDYLPERGVPGLWGDSRGNRSERYLACVGYLGNKEQLHKTKGAKELPSVIMCRGYYTRATLVAWDWDGKELKRRWMFDSYEGAELTSKLDNKRGIVYSVKQKGPWGDYSSQGNHSLRVADVDGDGFDEIIYGSCTIDHDGNGLYSTKLGHGDAMHLAPMLPNSDELYVWQCHEEHGKGSTLREAATGKILFQIPFEEDCGRCMAADIDPTNPGMEMWSICTNGIRNYKGELIAAPKGLSINMAVWWDGDLSRELLNWNTISKYDWTNKSIKNLVRFQNAHSINGTKAVPCLQGDLIGDWREEVLLASNDHQHLYLYVTPYPTQHRIMCLLQDIPYRHSLTVENVAYNQPTHLGVKIEKIIK